MPADDFEQALVSHLSARGLGDQAAKLIADLLDTFLSFKVDPTPSPEFDAYVCFAFGNVVDGTGNFSAGPVNELLSQVVERRYSKTPKKIIAQWEIGELLRDRSSIPQSDLVSVGPKFDRTRGKAEYLSTQDFAKFVASQCKDNNFGRRLLVVAQWFHLARCVRDLVKAELEPVIIDQDEMPREFCNLSDCGQLWTTDESLHVLNTLIGSLDRYRKVENEKWMDANPLAPCVLPNRESRSRRKS
ncbi:MAG TPA: hypothetical protein VKE40_17335 [Gemmataceae bacterium]|nr:hypothetical protein [Gemmataceae bacterium]